MPNTYLCFYRDKKITVEADTTLAARDLAAKQLKVKKAFEVSVHLVAVRGEPYKHSTADL
jgi:hypothetical protein